MELQQYKQRLEQGQLLSEAEVHALCELTKELLMEESNVVAVNAPVNVCGDIHGQFYDLLELFRQGGDISSTNYIFDGDYVDRGFNSVETVLYLFTLKCMYPHKVTLVRGNHESRQISMAYGFYDECLRKYGHGSLWKMFMDVFDYLPLAAIIEGKMLALHGGLSPEIRCIDQIRSIDRKQEIPTEGGFAHLMWSDPEEIEAWQPSPRGAGWMFGHEVVKKFNHLNGLDMIIRAHQLIMEGYKEIFDERLVTVWSAPNYCYRSGNLAAIMKIDENLNKCYQLFRESGLSNKQKPPSMVMPYFL